MIKSILYSSADLLISTSRNKINDLTFRQRQAYSRIQNHYLHKAALKNQSTDRTGESIISEENGPVLGLKTVSFNP